MSYQDMEEEDPLGFTEYVSSKCSDLDVSYLHVIRGNPMAADGQSPDIIETARRHLRSPLWSIWAMMQMRLMREL